MSTVWTEAVANTPRFHTSARRLWIEGARAPGMRNARPEGAVPGVAMDAAGDPGDGELPTYWTLTTDANGAPGATGLTFEVVDVEWPFGGDGLVLRVHGTPSATAVTCLNFDARDRSGTGGTVRLNSSGVECALVAGSTTGFVSGFPALFVARTSNVGALQGTDITNTALAAAALPARRTAIRTFTQDPPRCAAGIRFSYTSGVAVDITLALRWAAMEPRSPTTPVLQKAGVLTADGVEADVVTAALSTLSLPASGAGTYLWGGVVPQAAPAAANQTLFQIDNGSDNSRIVMRILAGGSTLDLTRVTATVSESATALGTIVAGTPFACGLTVDGAGRAFGLLVGGTGQEVTGAPTSGLTTLRLGNGFLGASPLNGGITLMQVSATVISDAELAERVAGLVP